MSSGETRQIGPYEIRGVLGRGGSATVYHGYDTALGREVAVKVLTTKEGQDPVLRARFRREALAVARLRHPNIVMIYTAGETTDGPYLVMELLPGGSLARRLGRPLALNDAAVVIRQIGLALDFAHDQGFLHRDVKPANIFLDGERVVLADFGIVKALVGDTGTRLTETGLTVGTPEYIAPEQALGQTLDGRADIYALGIVLYEMLTGVPPYGGNAFDVLNGHVTGKIPDPRRRNPALSPALSTVVLKALARYPEGRYQTGAAFADALDAAIAQGVAPGAAPAFDALDRGARTLIIDVQREQLKGTQPGALPPLPSGDQTVIGAIVRPDGPVTANTLPPLPSLTPPPPSAAPSPPRDSSSPVSPLVTALVTGNELTAVAGGATPTHDPYSTQQNVAPPLPQANQYATPYPVAQPRPLAAPVLATPQRSKAPLWIGLATAIVLALLLFGMGSVWLLNQRSTVAPTATVAAQGGTATAGAGATVPVIGGSPTVGITAIGSATARAGVSPTATNTPDPAQAQIDAGDRALQDGKFPDAIASYRAALQINPNSAGANRQLGLALWVWNHEPGEIEYLDKATKLAPNDALAWAYLSFSAIDTHQVERAYAAAQQAVRANPQQAEAYAAVANTYLRYPPDTNDPEASLRAAQEAIDRAKALDPNGIWTLWFDSQLRQSLEQYDAAFEPLDRMIAQRPNWPTLYYAKGGIYRNLELPAEARYWQEQALKLDPDYPYALTELGWLAYDDGEYAKARDFFDHALRTTDDTNDYAHVGYGWTLAAQNDYTNAIAHCRRAVQIDGRAPLGYECLGSAYLNGPKDDNEALASYRKVIELRPQWESGYIGVALVYSARGDYAGAETALRQGLAKVKLPRFINYWLGVTLYRQGKYTDAQPEFERAIALRPDNAVLQYWLGTNLEQLGRYPEARTAYERALTLDPGYQEAREALARLQQQGR
ncbi:MAG TPA: tetratricopeptide repeat protein [Thermomicrobiales bacterium]|jgi:serine/threonine-protein kinase